MPAPVKNNDDDQEIRKILSKCVDKKEFNRALLMAMWKN